MDLLKDVAVALSDAGANILLQHKWAGRSTYALVSISDMQLT